MKLDHFHMLSMRSRHNGYNAFVKQVLLQLSGAKDKPKWPKECLGVEIHEDMYKDLVRFRNLHLDDKETYLKMLQSLGASLYKIKNWNND